MLRKPPESRGNLEDRMTGKCATCGTVVVIQRWKASPPTPSNKPLSEMSRAWEDLYRAECSQCGAAVFLHCLSP
jgi:hypothetical protein